MVRIGQSIKKKEGWIEIHNVLHVPEMSEQLLSVKGIQEAGGKWFLRRVVGR